MKLKNYDKTIDDFVESLNDQTRSKFFPRRIIPPLDYYSPHYLNAFACKKSLELEKQTIIEREACYPMYSKLIAGMIQEDFPTYFMANDLFLAVKQTESPDFELENLKFPRSPMTICWRKDHWNFGRQTVCFTTILKDPDNSKNFFTWLWTCENDSYRTSVLSQFDLKTFTEMEKGEISAINGDYFQQVETLSLPEVVSVNVFCFKLLYILNTKPKLVAEVDSSTVQTPSNKPKKQKFYNPLWIGASYKLIKEHLGTHNSPVIHWRRGHLRNQKHGPGNSLSRIIWIEPTLVGT